MIDLFFQLLNWPLKKTYVWNRVKSAFQHYLMGNKSGHTPKHTTCLMSLVKLWRAFST